MTKKELQKKVDEYRSLQTLKAELEEQLDALKDEISGYMKENDLDKEITDDSVITYKLQSRATLDEKKLTAKFGDMTEYKRVTSYMVLRIK